jgi:hypothetical protein
MTFIDWSDTEEMLGLLAEFIREAKTDCRKDPEREKFLSKLLLDLGAFSGQLEMLTRKQGTDRLRGIYKAIDPEFSDDPVTNHVKDCLEEFERLESE